MSIKRFDGSNWFDAPAHKRFDGSNWIDPPSAKRFDGVNWIETARNTVSPSDVVSLYYTYTPAYRTYYEYQITCHKCNKPIFHTQREVETNTYQYYYYNASGIGAGHTNVSSNIFYGLAYACDPLRGQSNTKVNITKQQFRDTRINNAPGFLNNLYDHMRYRDDGSTRNLFDSNGYLICPWCE